MLTETDETESLSTVKYVCTYIGRKTTLKEEAVPPHEA